MSQDLVSTTVNEGSEASTFSPMSNIEWDFSWASAVIYSPSAGTGTRLAPCAQWQPVCSGCGQTVTHDGQGTKLTHAATDRVELGRAVERSRRASGWRLRTLATEGGPSKK